MGNIIFTSACIAVAMWGAIRNCKAKDCTFAALWGFSAGFNANLLLMQICDLF